MGMDMGTRKAAQSSVDGAERWCGEPHDHQPYEVHMDMGMDMGMGMIISLMRST